MSGRRDPCPLRLTSVTHVFGTGSRRVVAVDNIDLEVRPVEVVVIVGPSGSGKSTLLSIISCLLRPSAGRVEVMGVDVTALRESQLPTYAHGRSVSSSRRSTCSPPSRWRRTCSSP